MGYRVEYQMEQTEKTDARPGRFPVMLGSCLLVFLLLVNGLWPRGAQMLRELLLPGNPAVTVAALEDFAQELKAGEALESALESFCRKVIDDGKAAP